MADSENKQAIKDHETEMAMNLQKQIDRLKEQQKDVKRGRYSILELDTKMEKIEIADKEHSVARQGPIITKVDDSDDDNVEDDDVMME